MSATEDVIMEEETFPEVRRSVVVGAPTNEIEMNDETETLVNSSICLSVYGVCTGPLNPQF